MKPIYLVRRKGFDDYMSCSKERFEELGQKDLFETTIAYEAPREWVGLTEEQIFEIWVKSPAETEDRFAFVKAVIAALKEKNT